MRLFDHPFATAPVRLTPAAGSGAPTATRLGCWERLRHLLDRNFHVTLASHNAQVLDQALARLERMSPLQAQQNSVVEMARRFEKGPALRKMLTLPDSVEGVRRLKARVNRLAERALGVRLGLSLEQLRSAQGLAELAKADRLYNYLARYNEGCAFLNGEVHIKHGGIMTPWSQVPELLRQPRSRANGEPWPYDASGLCNRNMDVWPQGQLQPFFYADPATWGQGYLMSLCTSTLPEPRLMAGDHTWIRLYNPEGGRSAGEGSISAVGLYRPEKGQGVNPMESPLRVKPGTVRMDFSEFWGEPITELSFRITREQYEEIVERINRDHASGLVPFQLVDHNCTRYALELARVADVTIDAHTSFTRLLLPKRVAGFAQRLFNILPRFLQAVLFKITGLFWNLVQVRLGATKIDPALQGRVPRRTASFTSLAEALRTAGSRPQGLPTPWLLGQKITQRIHAQRRLREAELHERLGQALRSGHARTIQSVRQQLRDLRHWLPPENRGIRPVPSPQLASS